MSDYSEQGAVPVEDAAVDDPPTESEVREAHRRLVEEEGGHADGSDDDEA
jgi:hypothetical protein